MTLKHDTPIPQNESPHPEDPHHTASGSAEAPGGANASPANQRDLTHGQENYLGDPAGTESPADKNIGREPAKAGKA